MVVFYDCFIKSEMESRFWGGPSILLPMLGPKHAGRPGTTNPFVDTIPIKIYWKFGNDEIIHLPTNYDFIISLTYCYISVKYRRVFSRLGSVLSLKIILQNMIIIRIFYQSVLLIFNCCFEKLLSIPGKPLKVVSRHTPHPVGQMQYSSFLKKI